MSETLSGLNAKLVFLKVLCDSQDSYPVDCQILCFIDSHFGEKFPIFRVFINILISSNLYHYSFSFTVFLNPVSNLVSLNISIIVLPKNIFKPL